MSDSERSDLAAFGELEQVVHGLADAMAGWRRRALRAEAQLRELEERAAAAAAAAASPIDPARLEELERVNALLSARVDAARERTRQLLDRMRFLRQQHEMQVER